MKQLSMTLLLAVGMCHIAGAALKVPSSVFKMEELAEAKAKAAKDEKPLIFVYTDPGSS